VYYFFVQKEMINGKCQRPRCANIVALPWVLAQILRTRWTPECLQRFSFGYSRLTNFPVIPVPPWLIQPEYSNRRRYKPEEAGDPWIFHAPIGGEFTEAPNVH
jgi:hypothetical protein